MIESPGFTTVRAISTMPTPTSVAIKTCSGSISQFHLLLANFAKLMPSSGIGPK